MYGVLYIVHYSLMPSGSFDLAHSIFKPKPTYLIKHSSAVHYLICALDLRQ